MPFRWYTALALALLVHAHHAAAQTTEPIAVIVSADWTLEEISIAELRRLYLGRTTRLEDTRVVCFHLRSGSEGRDDFSMAVLGRTELEMTDYWIQQALTGGRLPPREVTSTDAMLEAIAARRGAIGYVPWSALRAAPDASLRVLRVEADAVTSLPTDPAYPIRARVATTTPSDTAGDRATPPEAD